jgi:hypothetical protein
LRGLGAAVGEGRGEQWARRRACESCWVCCGVCRCGRQELTGRPLTGSGEAARHSRTVSGGARSSAGEEVRGARAGVGTRCPTPQCATACDAALAVLLGCLDASRSDKPVRQGPEGLEDSQRPAVLRLARRSRKRTAPTGAAAAGTYRPAASPATLKAPRAQRAPASTCCRSRLGGFRRSRWEGGAAAAAIGWVAGSRPEGGVPGLVPGRGVGIEVALACKGPLNNDNICIYNNNNNN